MNEATKRGFSRNHQHLLRLALPGQKRQAEISIAQQRVNFVIIHGKREVANY